jgi:hypothetical protein
LKPPPSALPLTLVKTLNDSYTLTAWKLDRLSVAQGAGELRVDHILKTKDGPQASATADRIQFNGNTRRKSAPRPRFTNGVVGTVRVIDALRDGRARRQEKRQAPDSFIYGG